MRTLRHFKLLLLSLFAALNAFAQGLQLGRATLSHAAAKPLLRTEKLAGALSDMTFLRAVGGVAFDKEARPATGLNVTSMELKYNSRAADGHRLSIIINGQQVTANIYDWELVPIAKHANSSNFSCFTLFGELQNENAVVEQGTRVLNYSPEFLNTLLGLRLFQLDILISEPEISIHLPQKDNKYILGAGENLPDTVANNLGFSIFNEEFRRQSQYYTSYVICDENRDVQFSLAGDQLKLSSTPFYHFWRYEFQNSRGEILSSKYDEVSESVKRQAETSQNKKEWYESMLIERRPNFKSVIEQINEEREELEINEYTAILHKTLVEEMIQSDPKVQPVFVKGLSNSLSSTPNLFRNINPAVWDAGVKTMRYGAFFRYCKTNFNEQWRTFIAQIKRVLVFPVVKTPTLLNF